MLAFGRALMTRPKLVLLDEPSTGLSPKLTHQIMVATSALRAKGVTALVVEQNVTAVLEIADYVYVLDRGDLVREGPSKEVGDDAAIRAAYLGT